ncbi:UNVERIFIED_ORG: porin [Roseateles sp. XES5]|nr:porin [Roseateles sp. XES5]
MNIKSLLIGSAAALAAVSGAQAADAIVAAEPEPMEYVRVCDAFGTGYFYIPGTETCLKIGGFVRFQVNVGEGADFEGVSGPHSSDWDAGTMAYLSFDAKSDTEYGTLTAFIGLEADLDGPYAGVYVDEAYLQLGGFKAGSYYGPWDKGLNGETDDIKGGSIFNSVSYTYEGGAFSAYVSIDELEYRPTTTKPNGVGVTGLVTAALGGVSIDLLGSYDTEREEGSIRALLSADVGPGTFQVAGVWASDQNAYYNEAEWTVAASYAFKATDKLTITPGAQYWSDVAFVQGVDQWRVGLTLDYAITEGLAAKATVNYTDNDLTDDSTSGFLRLQRNF